MTIQPIFIVSVPQPLVGKCTAFVVFVISCLCNAGMLVADEVVSYDQVKEILRKRCVTCHNPDEMRGDLDLKDLSAIKMGSLSGAVVVPGEPSQSLLFTTIAHLEDPVMPPNSRQLPAREQDVIRRWIAGGAAELAAEESNSKMPAEVAKSAAAATAPAPGTGPLPVLSSAAQVPGFVAVRSLPQATAVTALDAHPTRDLAAFNGLQQAVLFEPSSGKLLGALDVPSGEVSAMRFSADGQLLLVAAGTPAVSGKVFAFELSSGQLVWERGDETDTILALDLSPDGKLLALGGPSKVVRVIDVATGDEALTLKKHTDWVLTVRFSPDGMLLASGDRFGGLIVWDPLKGTLFHNLRDHTDAVHAVAWDAAGEHLLSGGEDGQLRTWNMHLGQIEDRWNAGVGPILTVARSSEWLAAGGRKGGLSTWSKPSVPASSLEKLRQVEAIVPTPNGQLLIAADVAGQVSVLNASTLDVAHAMKLPIDPQALKQVFARIERAAQEFAANDQAEEKIAAVAQSSPAPSSLGDVPHSEPATAADASDASATRSLTLLLAEEVASNQRQLRSLESSLELSNQSLAAMAQTSAELSRTLQKLAESQQKLAEQVALQTKLLRDCQDRAEQLAEAVQAANEAASTEAISAILSR
jgi:hypothetical protein